VLSIGHLSRGHWPRLEGALGWGDHPDDPTFSLTWWLQRHTSGGLALGLRYAVGGTVLDDRIRVAAARVVPGGRARWFGFCPGCDRRVVMLYKPIVWRHAGDEWFRCRRCHHLGYASQLNRLSWAQLLDRLDRPPSSGFAATL